MQQILSHKKVLFLSTKYHKYEKEILICLKKAGAEVDFYYDDPLDYLGIVSPKVVQQIISRNLINKSEAWYRNYVIKQVKKQTYDFVFVLKGSLMTIPFITSLKDLQPSAKFIQYQWDSLGNYNYLKFLPFFDLNFTFDHRDAAQINDLHYLPMFARDDFYELQHKRKNYRQNIDLLFVGANHSNRIILLRELRKLMVRDSLTYKFYVYIPFLIGLKGVFISRKLKYEELMVRSVSKKKLKKLLLKSKYVLDLPSPNQSGVTPRALEALAAGCKLITSDKAIEEVDFFDKNFIHIVQANDLSSITEILKNGVNAQSSPDVTSYSLSNWTNKIFALENANLSNQEQISLKVANYPLQ